MAHRSKRGEGYHPCVVTEQDVRKALVAVIDPEIRRSVVELDMVRGVAIDGGRVDVTIALTVAGCPMKANLEQQVQQHVGGLAGVESVGLAFDVMTPEERTALRQRLSGGAAGEERKLSLHPSTCVIAVASGKGGVGKSTLTANLAAALALDGAEVGVVDADIYGYSMPRMLGVSRRPVAVDQMMIPPVNHDLKVMSIGFMIEEDTPMIWRGPMVTQALTQLLNETNWVDLDYLIIDLPPGTGDIQLTLCQRVPVSGALIVTTPQDIALLDAKKALKMFEKVDVPVLGIVENMALHTCSQCGHTEHVFGSGGGERMAQQYGVPLLGSLPLDIHIREQADGGMPRVVADPASAVAASYREIARKTAAQLALQARSKSIQFPKIVIQNT